MRRRCCWHWRTSYALTESRPRLHSSQFSNNLLTKTLLGDHFLNSFGFPFSRLSAAVKQRKKIEAEKKNGDENQQTANVTLKVRTRHIHLAIEFSPSQCEGFIHIYTEMIVSLAWITQLNRFHRKKREKKNSKYISRGDNPYANAWHARIHTNTHTHSDRLSTMDNGHGRRQQHHLQTKSDDDEKNDPKCLHFTGRSSITSFY